MDNLMCIRTVHRGRVVEKVGFCWKYRENAVDNHVDNVGNCGLYIMPSSCIRRHSSMADKMGLSSIFNAGLFVFSCKYRVGNIIQTTVW